MSRAFTGSTFGHNKLSPDAKIFADKKTKYSGVTQEIRRLVPSASDLHVSRLAELMGDDGLKCLRSTNVSFETSVLIYSRFLEWFRANNLAVMPSPEVKREVARRNSVDGISSEDLERTITLLQAIFGKLTYGNIEALARLVCKSALKVVWQKDPLAPLKQLCLKNHQDWLVVNGIDVALMTKTPKKTTPTNIEVDKLKPKKGYCCALCGASFTSLSKHIKSTEHIRIRMIDQGLLPAKDSL